MKISRFWSNCLILFVTGLISRLIVFVTFPFFPPVWGIYTLLVTFGVAWALYRATLSPTLSIRPAIRFAFFIGGSLVIRGSVYEDSPT